MRTFGIVSAAVLITLPNVLHAAVLINEIAWMGSQVSANDEWIELYNDGSAPVSLDGWVLTDNVDLDIVLAGTIGAGAFAVLERTDDESAQGNAFLIYTGALSNDGRTITLFRDTGAIADQVAGGEGWQEVGGDNVTKDTAQRTTAGWVTAVATPGALNASTGSSNEQEDTKRGASADMRSSKKEEPIRISLGLPDTELKLTINGPQTLTVNQQATFEVLPRGIGEHLMNSLVYRWNFGDLGVGGEGSTVTRAFSYPGNYVVVVEAAYARHKALARHEVVVLPVTLTIARNDQGDVLLHNTAKYEVDLSGYRLVGEEEVMVPPHTILVPNGTLIVPRALLERGTEKMITLYDSKNRPVVDALPGSLHRLAADARPVEPTPLYSASVPVVYAYTQDVLSEVPAEEEIEESAGYDEAPLATEVALSNEADVPPQRALVIGNAEAASVVQSRFSFQNDRLPYLGLAGIILLALYLLSGQKKQKYTDV